MKIMLTDILRLEDPTQYKLHLAARNEDGEHPLDEYVAGRWRGWNEYRGNKNEWTREYVFSLIDFYPKSDSWLFGGVFKVIERLQDQYKLEAVVSFEQYVGRLIVSFHRYQGMRGRAFFLENYLGQFEVTELLPQPYSGERFPGYHNLDVDFLTLEGLIKHENRDWRTALENIKGVYLILDKSNGKVYVGSAYGEAGIWSRWSCYIGTGHGWNDELTKLIDKKGIDYARRNFKFSLLEIATVTTPEDAIRERESFWKNVLMTREYGYNRN